MLFLSGCTHAVTMSGWQSSVERYIDNVGQGDPNVLREVTWPKSARAFSVIENSQPGKSQDANGLLLAAPQIGDRRWFVFLVGIVNKQIVCEIHLAALSAQGPERIWRTGPNDQNAVKAYLEFKQNLWHERFPDRPTPAPPYTIFPQEDDRFSVTVERGRVIVTHPASGARWELEVAPSQGAKPQLAFATHDALHFIKR
jgi:hypothetical protein